MRNLFFIFSFILILLLHENIYSSPRDINYYFIRAAKIAKPSVVNISIYKKSYYKNSTDYVKVADASGTIISDDGYIVTNYHVVSKGNFFDIFDSNGIRYELKKFHNGRYFLADIKTDIAIIKIYNPGRIVFNSIKIADSNRLLPGEWVIAIGNPYGLNQSITSGIVSSKGRDNIGFTDIEDFIQSDVSLNPGNSGGPLINLRGEMVGLNTAIRTVSGGYQGISFAIPSNIVKQVYYDLKKYGRVRRGWLGFLVKEKKLSPGNLKSILNIISVIKGSPAFLAGIKRGDIIKRIDGIEINSLGRLIKLIGNKPVGSVINIKISRNGKLIDYKFALREKITYKRIYKGLKYLYSKYGIEIDENAENENIVVSYVSPGTVTRWLKKGDIIISLNGYRVKKLEDFINRFILSNKKIFYMKILRDSRYYIINLDKVRY